ncbi:MAG TPA: SRPBCC domain-containing protein [Planctomycetota bacterium]|jgi:uncharacterized protein YndB with AHSA1/START domain|nr:SRPBCC domain-containing protein [Planctomycetota bacterium]
MDNFVADAIYIDAHPARVFEALLDPEEVLVWLDADSVFIDPRPGGVFKAQRADGSTVAGAIAKCEPAERLEIEDYFQDGPDGRRGPMKLAFTLEPQGPGVWMTVRQDGLDATPNWEAFAHSTRQEWVLATVALKRHVEQI